MPRFLISSKGRRPTPLRLLFFSSAVWVASPSCPRVTTERQRASILIMVLERRSFKLPSSGAPREPSFTPTAVEAKPKYSPLLRTISIAACLILSSPSWSHAGRNQVGWPCTRREQLRTADCVWQIAIPPTMLLGPRILLGVTSYIECLDDKVQR